MSSEELEKPVKVEDLWGRRLLGRARERFENVERYLYDNPHQDNPHQDEPDKEGEAPQDGS